MLIRRYDPADWSAVWPILQQTIAAGDTLTFAPESTSDEMHDVWVVHARATYVACSADGRIVGTYFIKANQPGLGSHVGNCGYVVAVHARGQGIAAAMCRHSQSAAVVHVFRSMQFNIVVATNTGAVRLWQSLGFQIVGTLPGVFQHRQLGFVDAHVMFKRLVD